MNILLASGSPRRRALLEGLGWNVKVIVPEVDEHPLTGESPENLCVRLAAAKAGKIAEVTKNAPRKHARHEDEEIEDKENALIVAADTIVVIDGRVLGKPVDDAESLLMLERLQGRTHDVLTGMCVIGEGKSLSGLERTKVRFRPLSAAAMTAYAATGEGRDKAGAYAIQGKGSLLVSSIEGDYFNVVGLPLCRLGLMLEEIGLKLPLQWGEI